MDALAFMLVSQVRIVKHDRFSQGDVKCHVQLLSNMVLQYEKGENLKSRVSNQRRFVELGKVTDI
jgi:hypothetical protein